MNKDFNIIIVGTGGQGLITLLKILAEASKIEGFDVKTSELHGLSQRGGSVECHIRFGKKIYSPLVEAGDADLVLALEQNESLRAAYYGLKKKTIFLINKLSVFSLSSVGKEMPLAQITKALKNFSKKIILLNASDIVKKETGSIVTTGIFMLGFCAFKKIIPLKEKSIIQAIEKVVPEKHLDLNRKIFKLSSKK
jgi:indolepyruvate ferredoxin oxidoreductase beta subunit